MLLSPWRRLESFGRSWPLSFRFDVEGDWALYLGSSAQPEPVAFQGLADLDEPLEVHWFDEERVGAQLIGQVHILDTI